MQRINRLFDRGSQQFKKIKLSEETMELKKISPQTVTAFILSAAITRYIRTFDRRVQRAVTINSLQTSSTL